MTGTGSGGDCATGRALAGARSVTVSPDGRFVYVGSREAGRDAVAVFARSATGALTQAAGAEGCITETTTPDCATGHDLGSTSLAATSGALVGATQADDTVVALARAANGGLSQAAGAGSCVSQTGSGGACGDGRALDGPTELAVSPGGGTVYAAARNSDAVAVLGLTGAALGQAPGTAGCTANTNAEGCAAGRALDGATDVTVSRDGKNVYAASANSDAIVSLAVGAGGALAPIGSIDGCVSETGSAGACLDGRALDGANAVVASPDGRHVYAGAQPFPRRHRPRADHGRARRRLRVRRLRRRRGHRRRLRRARRGHRQGARGRRLRPLRRRQRHRPLAASSSSRSRPPACPGPPSPVTASARPSPPATWTGTASTTSSSAPPARTPVPAPTRATSCSCPARAPACRPRARGSSGPRARARPRPTPCSAPRSPWATATPTAARTSPPAPRAPTDGQGRVALFAGGPAGPGDTPAAILAQSSPGAPGSAEAGDELGAAVAVRDLDGDGRAEIAAGVPGETVGAATEAGGVQVFDGTGEGPGRFVGQGNVRGAVAEDDDRFGATLEAGDVVGTASPTSSPACPARTSAAPPTPAP